MTIMRVAINCLQNDIYFCNKFALSFCSVKKLMLIYRTGVYNLQLISKTLSPDSGDMFMMFLLLVKFMSRNSTKY